MISESRFTHWLVNADDVVYPPSLRALPIPPRRLWVSGRLPPATGGGLLAIVGSRAVSQAGCRVISDLAAELVAGRNAEGPWAVISGGALGVDAAAHRGALAARGQTWAVLGCGIDVVYPDRHGQLFADIAASGGLISEYPPGTAPRPGQFPARNRLVAALADALLVGECRRGSGALITARLAAKLGRPIFALPGSPGSDGLIASGRARAVTSARTLNGALAGKACQVSARTAEMEELMKVLAEKPFGVAELAERCGVPVGQMLARLCEAELGGWVMRAPGGKFEVNRGN